MLLRTFEAPVGFLACSNKSRAASPLFARFCAVVVQRDVSGTISESNLTVIGSIFVFAAILSRMKCSRIANSRSRLSIMVSRIKRAALGVRQPKASNVSSTKPSKDVV